MVIRFGVSINGCVRKANGRSGRSHSLTQTTVVSLDKNQQFCVAGKTWVWEKTIFLTAKPIPFKEALKL